MPDAPINFQNDASETSATKIRITWQEGVSNGGSQVIDYWLYYDQGTDDWVELAGSLVSIFSYTTTISLTKGVTYSFKVASRNSVGYSEFSTTLAVLAAQLPDQPTAVATTAGSNEVIVSWDVDDRGSPISQVLVEIRESDGLSYTAETTACI